MQTFPLCIAIFLPITPLTTKSIPYVSFIYKYFSFNNFINSFPTVPYPDNTMLNFHNITPYFFTKSLFQYNIKRPRIPSRALYYYLFR